MHSGARSRVRGGVCPSSVWYLGDIRRGAQCTLLLSQPEFIAVALHNNPLYRPHTGLPANVALQNNPLYRPHTGPPANVALQDNPLYQPHNVHGGGGNAAAAIAVIYAIPMETRDGGGAAVAAAAAAAADGSRGNSQPAPDTVFYDVNADTYSTTYATASTANHPDIYSSVDGGSAMPARAAGGDYSNYLVAAVAADADA